MSSLKNLALNGAVWTFLGYGSSQGFRLISNLILTRLLLPEMFGLMSLVSTFLIGLGLFSDIGIGPNIIYSPRGNDPDFLNTAWTLQVIRGVALWLCCLLIAVPLANFYNNSQLIWLIPVVGLTAIFDGCNSTSIFTLTKDVDIRKITIFEVSIQLLTLTIMLVWAKISPTIWALVAGNLIGGILRMLRSHYLIDNYSNKLTWRMEIVKEIVAFGRWIFLSTAATFIAMQADKIILAKLLSFKILGIYTIALSFALLPQEIVSRVTSRVMLPLVSQVSNLPRSELRQKILSKRWLLLTSVGLMLVLLTCFGDLLIMKIYDHRYQEAAWMLPILALGVWPNLLYQTGVESLVAIGRPQYMAYSQFIKSLHVLIALPLGYVWFGLPGFIVMVAINDIELYGIISYGLCREKLNFLRQDLIYTIGLICVIALILVLRQSLGYGYPIQLLFPEHG